MKYNEYLRLRKTYLKICYSPQVVWWIKRHDLFFEELYVMGERIHPRLRKNLFFTYGQMDVYLNEGLQIIEETDDINVMITDVSLCYLETPL